MLVLMFLKVSRGRIREHRHAYIYICNSYVFMKSCRFDSKFYFEILLVTIHSWEINNGYTSISQTFYNLYAACNTIFWYNRYYEKDNESQNSIHRHSLILLCCFKADHPISAFAVLYHFYVWMIWIWLSIYFHVQFI